MSLVYEAVRFGNTGVTGYFLVLCALAGIVVFTVWKGRATRFKGALIILVYSLGFFVVARSPFWEFSGSSGAHVLLRIVLFSVLNLVSFYFLAVATLRIEPVDAHVNGHRAAGPENDVPKLPDPLLREMLLVGLALAGAFVAVPATKTTTVLVTGFINALLAGATIRLVAFNIGRMHRVPGARVLAPVAVAAVLSWVLYEAVPIMPARPVFWTLQAARWVDVLTLAFAVGALVAVYVRWGLGGETKAREMEAEMETAKSELARLNKIAKDIYEDSNDLMIKQKQQALASMRRAEGLEKVFEVGVSIQRRRRLDDVLQMIVELVQSHVGFKTVTLRLFNEKTENFEARAHVGLSPEIRDRVLSYRVPSSEFEKMCDPRFRISKSYFIKGTTDRHGEEQNGEEGGTEGSMLVQNTWGEIEMLVVPLVTEEGKTIAYLTTENPHDPTLSLSYVIEMLERISTLGVIGIRNAKIFEALKEKDGKLKDFTEKLSKLNNMKSNFVATMSHEFRTPLTSIKAYCDTLIKNADAVDRGLLKEFLYVIDEESSRLMTLVEDILDFSRIESGAMKFERRPCNLNQVVLSAASELTKNFELKEIVFSQDLPKETLIIHAEQDLVKQLVVSLLHNASKFCRPRGHVWLRLENEVAAARIIVEDDGVGIPEDQLEKVFDQFYQVDNSNTREHGGSGLGLALCRSIVEWHNGRIWVQNMTGSGARFVAILPKKQAVTRSHVMGITSTVRRVEVEKLLELVVESVSELMAATKVSLMLVDPAAGELRIEAAIGIQEEVVEHTRVKVGEGISGKVVVTRAPMLVTDIEADQRVARNNNEPVYGSKSFLSVPIVSKAGAVGVVNVSCPVGRKAFTDRDRLLLELLSKRIAVALEKVEKFKDISVVYERVVDTYKAILDSKRFVEAKDDEYMTTLVLRVATKLGMDAGALATIPYVMAVYDLGLAKVGSHILNKPAGLSVKDREEVENHTITGTELLRAIEPEPRVGEIVLYHHENYDGSGYPGKLKAQSIPLEARIIRVADSLKALISERPYQRRYTFEEAIEILKHRSGSFFDPKVVDAFIEAIDELGVQKGPRPAGDTAKHHATAGARSGMGDGQP